MSYKETSLSFDELIIKEDIIDYINTTILYDFSEEDLDILRKKF